MENDKIKLPEIPEWINDLAEETRTGDFSHYFTKLTPTMTFGVRWSATSIYYGAVENVRILRAETIAELEDEAKAEGANFIDLKSKPILPRDRIDPVNQLRRFRALFWSIVLMEIARQIKSENAPAQDGQITRDLHDQEKYLKAFYLHEGKLPHGRKAAIAIELGVDTGHAKNLRGRFGDDELRTRLPWVTIQLLERLQNEIHSEEKTSQLLKNDILRLNVT